MHFEPPGLGLVTWGRGADVDKAVARAMAEHTAQWRREERRQEDAERIGVLVRDAILAGSVTPAEVVGWLTTAPPPRPGLWRRLVFACWPTTSRTEAT